MEVYSSIIINYTSNNGFIKDKFSHIYFILSQKNNYAL